MPSPKVQGPSSVSKLQDSSQSVVHTFPSSKGKHSRTYLNPMGDHTNPLQILNTPLMWPPLIYLLHFLNHLYYLRSIVPRNHGHIPFSHTRNMAEHERVDFRVGWNVPTGMDSIAFANVEVLGDKLNDACSGTVILVEDDPALHGHFMLLFLVKLKESV